MPSFLDKVNRTLVAPELLGEAMQMHAETQTDDRRVFKARSIALFQMLADDVLWAAAREPLIESADKQASFDADGFSRRLLELTAAKGQA